MLIAEQMKIIDNSEGGLAESYSFREFIEGYVQENKVTDRVFYLSLPLKDKSTTSVFGKTDDSMTYRELEERIEVIREWLSKSMLKTRRLDNVDLVTFLASFFSDEVYLQPGCTSYCTSHKGGENVLE